MLTTSLFPLVLFRDQIVKKFSTELQRSVVLFLIALAFICVDTTAEQFSIKFYHLSTVLQFQRAQTKNLRLTMIAAPALNEDILGRRKEFIKSSLRPGNTQCFSLGKASLLILEQGQTRLAIGAGNELAILEALYGFHSQLATSSRHAPTTHVN